ncbi:MAG: hypothetical protein U7127_22465 [Phormidium sp.]
MGKSLLLQAFSTSNFLTVCPEILQKVYRKFSFRAIPLRKVQKSQAEIAISEASWTQFPSRYSCAVTGGELLHLRWRWLAVRSQISTTM